MRQDVIRLFGSELVLLHPPEYDKDGRLLISFNYFEEESWEDAGYDAENSVLFSGKIGGKHFHRVICAAYVLMEFYSETFGMAAVDGHVLNACEPIAWLNHLFHENYTNARAWDLWRVYKLLPEDSSGREDDLFHLLAPGEIHATSNVGFLKYMYIAHRAELEQELALLEDTQAGQPEHSFSIFYSCKLLHRSLEAMQNTQTFQAAEVLERCKTILLTQVPLVWNITRDSAENLFALAAKLLPWEITVKFMADAFELEFQDLYDELEPLLKDQKAVFNDDFFADSIQNFTPIEPLHTASFLHCTDDDRVWFWRENGNVSFSLEMEAWLSELAVEFQTILTPPEPLLNSCDFLRQFWELLQQINERFHPLYCFASTFYEFIYNPYRREYQAAVLLLRKLAERSPDNSTGECPDQLTQSISQRQTVKRYLALLSNSGLRKRTLGF